MTGQTFPDRVEADPAAPLVPGVRLEKPVAARPGVWSGHRSDGHPVEVAVVRLSPDPGIRAAAFAAIGPLEGVGGSHTQRVLDRTGCPDGVALVLDRVAGVPAGGLRRLAPGQLVTLGAPLARELDAFHRRGLALGASRTELGTELVVTSGGRPMLTVGGWAARRAGPAGAAAPAGPAADVAVLVAFLEAAAARFDPATARRWERVRSAADAGALAAALRRFARPRPLPSPRGDGPGRAARRPVRTQRVPPALRRAGPALALGGAVLMAAVLGWLSVSHPNGTPAPPRPPAAASAAPPAPPASPPDWRAVVTGLDAARADAFGGRRPLADVDLPGGRAYVRDAAALADLQRRHLRADGPRPQLAGIRLLSGAPADGRVTLEVIDTLPGYALVPADGGAGPGTAVAGRGRRVWRVELRQTPSGWRVSDVVAG